MLVLNSIRLTVKINHHRGKVSVIGRVPADQSATFILSVGPDSPIGIQAPYTRNVPIPLVFFIFDIVPDPLIYLF